MVPAWPLDDVLDGAAAPGSAPSVSTISPSAGRLPTRSPRCSARTASPAPTSACCASARATSGRRRRRSRRSHRRPAPASASRRCTRGLRTRRLADLRTARRDARRRRRPHCARVRRRTVDCRRWPTRSTSAPQSAGSAAGCSSTRGTSSAATSRGRCSARSSADQIALVHLNDAPRRSEDDLVLREPLPARCPGQGVSGSPSSPPHSTRSATTASSASRCCRPPSAGDRPPRRAQELLDSLQAFRRSVRRVL